MRRDGLTYGRRGFDWFLEQFSSLLESTDRWMRVRNLFSYPQSFGRRYDQILTIGSGVPFQEILTDTDSDEGLRERSTAKTTAVSISLRLLATNQKAPAPTIVWMKLERAPPIARTDFRCCVAARNRAHDRTLEHLREHVHLIVES